MLKQVNESMNEGFYALLLCVLEGMWDLYLIGSKCGSMSKNGCKRAKAKKNSDFNSVKR